MSLSAQSPYAIPFYAWNIVIALCTYLPPPHALLSTVFISTKPVAVTTVLLIAFRFLFKVVEWREGPSLKTFGECGPCVQV